MVRLYVIDAAIRLLLATCPAASVGTLPATAYMFIKPLLVVPGDAREKIELY